MPRHQQAFRDLYKHLRDDEHVNAETTKRFYDEYFAVNDLPAEFYLETVGRVFQDFLLAKGELTVRGEKVEPSAIRRTALFTVEGERDDICSIGQTVAAHDLCTGIRPYMKSHHVQLGCGPLRRVQRAALATADLPARARDDPRCELIPPGNDCGAPPQAGRQRRTGGAGSAVAAGCVGGLSAAVRLRGWR